MTAASLQVISRLNSYSGAFGENERNAIRYLAVAISEALRFANVITWMMALLRGDLRHFNVGRLAKEIRNWSRGSTENLPNILLLHE